MSRSCLCAFVTLNKKITYLLTYFMMTLSLCWCIVNRNKQLTLWRYYLMARYKSVYYYYYYYYCYVRTCTYVTDVTGDISHVIDSQQCVALTGRNTTARPRAAPWRVTLHRGVLQTPTDNRQRRQTTTDARRAKQYCPLDYVYMRSSNYSHAVFTKATNAWCWC